MKREREIRFRDVVQWGIDSFDFLISFSQFLSLFVRAFITIHKKTRRERVV
jgi:hypothetical protein